MQFLVTTTGTAPSVNLEGIVLTHPTVDYDLLLYMSLQEINTSVEIAYALTAARITAKDENGKAITSTSGVTPIHQDVAGEISSITTKATPVAGDYILIEDSADDDNKKRTTLGGLSGATVTLDSITLGASRDNASATNIYLYTSDGLPTNQSPFILPFDCNLIAISASTASSETWVAEIHNATTLTLITNAILALTAATSGESSSYGTVADLNAGDKIAIYCNGTGIDKPNVTAIFRRRY